MSNCDLALEYFCNLASKIYLTINISTLILIYFLQKDKFYEDECFLQAIYFSELNPISEWYFNSFKTNESIELGYLEEFSGKYTKIYSKKIYKWKNEYINVKRRKSSEKDTHYKVLIDIKVSFKRELDFIYNRNSNICFSQKCISKSSNCKIPFILLTIILKIQQIILYQIIQFKYPQKIHLNFITQK